MSRWFIGEVVKIEEHGPMTKSFFVRVPQNQPFHFLPGQFVVMDLPISQKRIGRWRSYSIANTPNKENILEFCIVQTPEGPATDYIFNKISKGHTIKIKGPEGSFSFLHNLDKEIVLICTGTGIAPFRSILHHIQQKELPFSRIHLIYGTQTRSKILYKKEMEAFQSEYKNFTYDIALSRERYKGYQGYVHKIYLTKYPKPNPETYFYLCGWQNMIDEAVSNLISKRGYSPTQVTYELYG